MGLASMAAAMKTQPSAEGIEHLVECAFGRLRLHLPRSEFEFIWDGLIDEDTFVRFTETGEVLALGLCGAVFFPPLEGPSMGAVVCHREDGRAIARRYLDGQEELRLPLTADLAARIPFLPDG